jgi:hypothetical protein
MALGISAQSLEDCAVNWIKLWSTCFTDCCQQDVLCTCIITSAVYTTQTLHWVFKEEIIMRRDGPVLRWLSDMFETDSHGHGHVTLVLLKITVTGTVTVTVTVTVSVTVTATGHSLWQHHHGIQWGTMNNQSHPSFPQPRLSQQFVHRCWNTCTVNVNQLESQSLCFSNETQGWYES